MTNSRKVAQTDVRSQRMLSDKIRRQSEPLAEFLLYDTMINPERSKTCRGKSTHAMRTAELMSSSKHQTSTGFCELWLDSPSEQSSRQNRLS
eukprot:scaffold594025_cov17-Prasinocladus_malaysianus.AAC.1